MLTEKDYCDYENCVALRELGYKGISRFFYATKESPLRRYSYDQILTTRIADSVGHILAISLYSAQKWLREEKGVIVEVFVDDDSDTPITYNIYKDGECVCHHHGGYWLVKEWNVALSEGIKRAVKILKENETIHE